MTTNFMGRHTVDLALCSCSVDFCAPGLSPLISVLLRPVHRHLLSSMVLGTQQGEVVLHLSSHIGLLRNKQANSEKDKKNKHMIIQVCQGSRRKM